MTETTLPVSTKKKSSPSQPKYNNLKSIICIGHALTATCLKLEKYGYRVITAEKCQTANQKIFGSYRGEGILPEIFIGDAEVIQTEGKMLFDAIYSFSEFRNIPFLLVASSHEDVEFLKPEGSFRVDDIVAPDIGVEQLYEKIMLFKMIRETKQEYFQREISSERKRRNHFTGLLLKQYLDKLIAFSALAILSPVLLLIAVAIKIDSRGPVFYVSKRAGRGYKVFRFYKFRTMVINADKKLDEIAHLNQYSSNREEAPVFIKVNNDPRITKLGVFLRKTSLDELPQLINVLKGDMSLVGNRPLPLYEASTLTTDYWVERFLAPAGITGLWQISKRGKKEMSVDERISLDIDYAHKNSFLYDLLIMWHTPNSLIQKENV